MKTAASYALLVCLGAAVCAQPVPLGFSSIDVQYSSALNRLIMISANPNQLHIVNAGTGADTAVSLPSQR